MAFEVEGKYTTAQVFSDTRDEKAVQQIRELVDQPFVEGAKVRIMPDYHWGAGCTIGFTANLGKYVVPNLVGVDIGCGMCVVELGKVPEKELDLPRLDTVVRQQVPSGFDSHGKPVARLDAVNKLLSLDSLSAPGKKKSSPADLFQRQIGTLGGGNHFIEINRDDDGNSYLVIHSGSRNMGKQIADHYQRLAIREAQSAGISVPRMLAYLTGVAKDDYLHDMQIAQKYAAKNRLVMAERILRPWLSVDVTQLPIFQTIHNYLNFDDGIIRKGAVSARDGERIIIPMNMRDGSILATGTGNADWNYSAPHGAGRLMGRAEARKALNLGEFERSMRGIYTTTVGRETLDEAPMAYKPMDEILRNIAGSVRVEKVIRPVYNFKAGKE